MLEITQYTEEEQISYKNQHPESKPKNYAILDDGIIYSFYDTREEAQKELNELQIHDAILQDYSNFLRQEAALYNMDYNTVKAITFRMI